MKKSSGADHRQRELLVYLPGEKSPRQVFSKMEAACIVEQVTSTALWDAFGKIKRAFTKGTTVEVAGVVVVKTAKLAKWRGWAYHPQPSLRTTVDTSGIRQRVVSRRIRDGQLVITYERY